VNQTELIGKMTWIFASCASLAERKNSDYASANDALENFRDFGTYGIIVRMSDKFKRVKNVAEKSGSISVLDESLSDTLMDIINYAAIAIIMGREDGNT